MNKLGAIKSAMILLCTGIILLTSAEPITGQVGEHSANYCLPVQDAVQHEHKEQMNTTSAFDREMMESMKKMDRDMMAAPMTGSPDSDFSAMMIPHHQGAIDMAKAFLLHGKDPVLLRLAKNITVTQQQEIEIMRHRQVAPHQRN